MGWNFIIHEDSETEEAGNMLIHSATTLNIANDKAEADSNTNRGKENVLGICAGDPLGTAGSAECQKHKTNRIRTPLGNLDVAEFYPEDCDMDFWFVIPARMREELSTPRMIAEEERVAG